MRLSETQRFTVWQILSFAWTEIGIEASDYESFVERAGLTPGHLGAIDRLLFKDLALAFAYEAMLAFSPLWMFLPDWGFDPELLRKRLRRWHSTPWILHLLNPVRILYYPLSLAVLLPGRRRLRRAIRNASVLD